MKRIVRRRTEITIETHETTVRHVAADVVAYSQPDGQEMEPPGVVIDASGPNEDTQQMHEGNDSQEDPL